MVDNPIWEICERVAEVQALLDDHVAGGKPSAADVVAKALSRDEAFLIAVNIAKLPSVPRQILKDIPRPPNSASRDD
jgi:hypothetical protein